jgi:hypothetical protein
VKKIVIDCLEQLSNYTQPQSPGALLKAVRILKAHLVPCIFAKVGFSFMTKSKLLYNTINGKKLTFQAFCCANIVSLDDPLSLREQVMYVYFIILIIYKFQMSLLITAQLLSKYQGGFELHTWSNLPTGSGLGTSSILAGAVMAVLWRAGGRAFTKGDVVHAVLHLEQMLTTGGGWQDQVGVKYAPNGFLNAFFSFWLIFLSGRWN